MKAINRYKEYQEEDFDKVMLYIKNGRIKTGKYAHLVKIDKNRKMKGKVFFGNENDSSE